MVSIWSKVMWEFTCEFCYIGICSLVCSLKNFANIHIWIIISFSNAYKASWTDQSIYFLLFLFSSTSCNLGSEEIMDSRIGSYMNIHTCIWQITYGQDYTVQTQISFWGVGGWCGAVIVFHLSSVWENKNRLDNTYKRLYTFLSIIVWNDIFF